MRHWMVGVALVCCGALFLPAHVHAQATISGIVQDSTGGVLPGVTVEAASPALIERVRSVTTDNAWQYTIVELRPGTYTVTFSLTGFGSVKREGMVEGAFIAQINADLNVVTVQETLTVSADAPLVDVQGTRQQFVANREMLDALPTARTFNGRAAMIPGVTTNKLGAGTSVLTVHGSPNGDAYTYIDGMRSGKCTCRAMGNTGGGPGWVEIPYNDAGAAEVSFDTGAQSAEMQVAGIV